MQVLAKLCLQVLAKLCLQVDSPATCKLTRRRVNRDSPATGVANQSPGDEPGGSQFSHEPEGGLDPSPEAQIQAQRLRFKLRGSDSSLEAQIGWASVLYIGVGHRCWTSVSDTYTGCVYLYTHLHWVCTPNTHRFGISVYTSVWGICVGHRCWTPMLDIGV